MIVRLVEAKQGAWLKRGPGVSASLAGVGSVSWPTVIALDNEFGGLSVPVGARELWVGLDSALEMPMFRRVIDGREHVLIGMFSPMWWYVDEQGVVLEVTPTGQVLGRFAALREAIETALTATSSPLEGPRR